MKFRYATVDVFSDRLFGGNPLAVIFDAESLTALQMQAIAREFNYSETTFVLPPEAKQHTARIRIFTPTQEIPFAGHPNVGTAVAFALDYAARGLACGDDLAFEEAAGVVDIRLCRKSGFVAGAEIVAPQQLVVGASIARKDAADCLTLNPSAIVVREHPPQVVSVGLPFLAVELASRDALRAAKPSLAAHERVLPPVNTDAVFAYVREDERVLQARMFSPLDAIIEDPATGSAAAATIALLATLRTDRDEEVYWTVSQGVDMGRPSTICGLTTKRDGEVKAVAISGRVQPVMEGCLSFPTSTETRTRLPAAP